MTLMRSDGFRWLPARVEQHEDLGTVRELKRDELIVALRELVSVDREGMEPWSEASPFFAVSLEIRDKVDLSGLNSVQESSAP